MNPCSYQTLNMKTNWKTQLFLPVFGRVAVLTLPTQQRGGKIRLAAVTDSKCLPGNWLHLGLNLHLSSRQIYISAVRSLWETSTPCASDFSSSQSMNTHRFNTSGNEDIGSCKIMRNRKLFHIVNEKCMWVFIVLRWSRKLWSSVKMDVAGLSLLKKPLLRANTRQKIPQKNPAMGQRYFALLFCIAMLLILKDQGSEYELYMQQTEGWPMCWVLFSQLSVCSCRGKKSIY